MGARKGRMRFVSGFVEFITGAHGKGREGPYFRTFVALLLTQYRVSRSPIGARHWVTLPPYFTGKDPILSDDRRVLGIRERCEQRTNCMDHRIASARPLGRRLAAASLLASLLLAVPALAQTAPPAAAPKAPAKQPTAQKQAPAAPAAPAQPPAGQAAEVPQLMYSPWMKVCGKGPDTNNKQVCVITKDGRLENGMPVAIVQLFEPEGDQKVLRITVPLGMQIAHGTRMLIDQGAPAQQPYKICFPVGCMSDYPVTDDMMKQLKSGQMITVQAINMQGTPISLPLPLVDFAKAYDGPATDPKAFEEQQRKLQEELQKKAEEARKKLEAQQPSAAAPTAPPAAKK